MLFLHDYVFFSFLIFSNKFDFQLIQLPCQPNVVTLLENYLKYLARNYFANNNKPTKKNRPSEVLDKHQLEKRLVLSIARIDKI